MRNPVNHGRRIKFFILLSLNLSCLILLSFQVHAVKSEVSLTERRIVALDSELLILETEFQARANQRQLSEWNAVEFGYTPPRSDQYLENEAQLASLGAVPRSTVTNPIRVVMAKKLVPAPNVLKERSMVSPISGQRVTFAAVSPPSTTSKLFENFVEFIVGLSPTKWGSGSPVLVAEATE